MRASTSIQLDRRVILGWAIPAGVLLVATAVLASIGGSGGPGFGVPPVILGVVSGAAMALPWFGAAFGYGRALGGWLLGREPSRSAARFAVGLSVMLTLGHLVGVAGLLNPIAAWAVVLLGLGLGAPALWELRAPTRVQGPGVIGLRSVAALGLAIGIVAASNPPAWLWDSEFGGYDALSYHLQLPREWLASGGVWPSEHNVYSYLPSYLESTFAMLGALTLAPVGEGDLLVGNGWRIIGLQQFHLSFILVTAWFCGVATSRLVRGRARAIAGTGVGTLVMTTPWLLVVGSLAYNELALTAMIAGAIVIAIDRRTGPGRPGRCGGVTGWVVGVACGLKPTALLLAAPVVGGLLLARGTMKSWPKLVGVGIVGGTLALSPWLVRNTIASGNPVFPFAAEILGEGHWTPEQHARWERGHTFNGGMSMRLRRLVWTDPDASERADTVERHRGMSNPQWGILWPVGGAALIVGVVMTRSRRTAITLGLGVLACLFAWLKFTHLQSRFLIPVAVPVVLVIGVAAASIRKPRPIPFVALLTVALAQLGFAVPIFLGQRDDRPNLLLPVGPSFVTGEDLPTAMIAQAPERYINRRLTPDDRVLLLGDAWPTYFETTPIYATTWDRQPLAVVIGEPVERWSALLRELGATHVLVNRAEIARLTDSGFWDERLTLGTIEPWLGTLGRPVRDWPEADRVLYALPRSPR
ncbi:MAG: hypothetical protein AAGI17_10995 [Planctomycetota bacterium]